MLSSLVFHHTLRDARFLLEGVEYCKEKKIFLSADSSALRVWTNTRQVKTVHVNDGFELLSLEYLEYLKCFLVIYYLRETGVGYVEVWDSDVKRMQKIKLKFINSRSQCLFSPDKTFFIMTDNDENMHFYNISAIQKIKHKEGPWFPRASDANKVLYNKSSSDSTRDDQQRYFPQIKIRKVQTLLKTSLGYENLQVLHIFNANCFAFIASRVLYVFKRLKEKESFIVDVEEVKKKKSVVNARKKSNMKVIKDEQSMDYSSIQTGEQDELGEGEENDEEDNEEDEEEGEDEEGEEEEEALNCENDKIVTPDEFFEDYHFTLLLKFESLFQAHGVPVSMQTMGAANNFLCVTFTNGYIGIYECGDMFSTKCLRSPPDGTDHHDSVDADDLEEEPVVVAFFKAHTPLSSSPFVSVQLQTCPWQTVPGDVYALEMFSLGSDYKICHWGLRRRLDNPALSAEDLNSPPPPSAASLLRPNRNMKKCTYEVDLLGSFRFPQDSVEIQNLSKLLKKYRHHPIRLKIIPFDIQVATPMAERFADHSSRRGLCCSVGGALGFFLLQQPLRVVVPLHNPSKQFLSCSKGDLVAVELLSAGTEGGASEGEDNASMGDNSSDFSLAVSTSTASQNQKMTDELMYVLSDGTVHGYALRSGVLMFQMSVRKLPVNLLKVGDSDHMYMTNSLEGSHRFKAMKGSLVDLKQGDPCCVQYCRGTGHLAVGYTDGGVSLLAIHHADIEAYKHGGSLDIAPSSNIPVKTSDTHHTPVTKIANISLSSSVQSKDAIEYLVIGDEYGLMSIWSMKDRHQLNASAEVVRRYVGHCHKKGISHIEVIYLEHSMSHQSIPTRDAVKNQCVILTTCLSGDIKAWSLSTELGVVTLVGCLRSQKKILAVGVVLLPFLDTLDDKKYLSPTEPTDNEHTDETTIPSPNVSGPTNSGLKEKKDEEFNIICATGHNDGKLCSWIFSSNERNARDGPTSVVHAHSSSVISIVSLPDVRKRETFIQQDIAKVMLSASNDGSACLFGINKSGFLVPLHLYFSPGPTRAISVCHGAVSKTPKAEVEIILINESNMTSFIALTAPYNSSVIPVRWRQDTKPKLLDDLYVPIPVSHLLRRNSSRDSTISDTDSTSISRMASTASAEVLKNESTMPRSLSLDLYVGNNGRSSFSAPAPVTTNMLETSSPKVKVDESPRSMASSGVGAGSVNTKSVGNRMTLYNLKETSARQQWMQGGGGGGGSLALSADTESEMDDELNEKPPTPSPPAAVLDNWTDTLDIRTELFLAKKDGALIALFRQRSVKDSNHNDVIRARDAVEILDRWISKNIDDDINGQSISKKQILEIFTFLGIAHKDMIDFIKVAKIASVLKTLYKGQGANEPFEQTVVAKKNRLNKKYKAMKSTTTLVTYNDMGERIIQKIPLVDKTVNGISDGYGDEIRQIWALEPPRVLFHINQGRNKANDTECIMKRIPLHIVKRLYGKVKVPTRWKSSMEHWFDLRRTVRVARTLFDMRFVAQRDFLIKHGLQKIKNYDLPSMTDLVIKYFERSYGKGHGDMNVAHQKVVTFLEALCQYSEYSILNSLRFFIFSEEEEYEEGTQASLNHRTVNTYEWLYTEGREWVKTNCMFQNGGEVQNDNQTVGSSSLHAGGIYLEAHSVTSLGGGTSTLGAGAVNSMNVQWLLIRRSDALLCVREMLQTRGGYGPAIIENLTYMVDSVLPPISPVSAMDNDEDYEYSQPVRDYIDFEQFLEVLAFEMKKHDQEIGRIRDKLFSTKSLPDAYLHATSTLQNLMRHDKNMPITNDEVDEFVSVYVFQSTQDMMQLFIGLDPSRSGFIPTKLFKKALRKVLAIPYDPTVVMNTESVATADSAFREEDNKEMLVKECIVRFGDTNGLDNVGYIDFIAVILAFILNCPEHLVSVNSEWMLHAVVHTRKSLDRDKGMVLLNYLSFAQGYRQQQDVHWMVHRSVKMNSGDHDVGLSTEIKNGVDSILQPGGRSGPLGVEMKHPGKISYEGQWSMQPVRSAYDEPGNLTIKRILPEYVNGASEVGLSSDGVVSRSLMQKSADSNLYIVPTIKNTTRTLSTLHGEVFASRIDKVTKPKEKVYISQMDVGENAFLGLPKSTDQTVNNKSNRFPPKGSQVIQGIRFDNSQSLLAASAVPMANTQLKLTLPSEVSSGSVVVYSPGHSPGGGKDSSFTPPHSPSDKTPLVTSRSTSSLGNSQMDLPQEYVDLQNRSYILSEIEEMKANKKERVNEEQRLRRELTNQGIVKQRSLKSLISGAISSDSFDGTLEEGSQEGESAQSVTEIINLFSKVSEVYPEGFVDQCIDESTKQLYELRDLEEEMAKELQDAALFQQLQIHEKYLRKKLERKEMRKKEKESMLLLEREGEERRRRREAGRQLERQRAEQEEADKKAAQEEERQKTIQRRAEREQAELLKQAKARKEEERQEELRELLEMRRVEKVSIAAAQYAKAKAEADLKRKLAEEAAREAKEAAERQRVLEREERAAEKARKEEERLAKEAERKFKDWENDLRFSEMLHMQEEDWDVAKPYEPEPEPVVEEVEVEEKEEVESEEESEEDDYSVVQTKGEINDAKLRLVELIQNLKVARKGNSQHPRRSKEKKENFFQPMMFEKDLQFNPFMTPSYMQGEYGNLQLDDDEEDPEKGFDDITRTIQAFKTKQHNDKLQRLYQFKNDNIPISEWTTLVLKESVDWEEFFDDDFEKVFPGVERQATTPAEKKKRLLRKKEKAQRKQSVVVTKEEKDVLMVVGTTASTLDEDEDDEGAGAEAGEVEFDTEPKSVTPLPLGKVLRNKIRRGQDQYFQIEVGDLSSILTIELNSTVSPDADCFEVDMSTKGYFPSKGKAEVKAAKYQAACRHVIVYNPAERVSEDTFVKLSSNDPRQTSTLIVGVHHKPTSKLKSAPYEIWALTTRSAPDSEVLENVSKTVQVLDIISSTNEDDLWKNMPKVHRDAHKKVFTEKIICAQKVDQSEKRNIIDSKVDDEERESLENFVTKSGRLQLRRNLSSSLNASSRDSSSIDDSQFTRLDRPVDPNNHADLFVPPALTTLDDVLDRSYSQSMVSMASYRESMSLEEPLLPLINSSGGGRDENNKYPTVQNSSSLSQYGDDHGHAYNRYNNADEDDFALRRAEHEALRGSAESRDRHPLSPTIMLRASESLPQLDSHNNRSAYGLATDSFFLNQSSSSILPQNQPATHAKFPYISKTKIRREDMNPQPKPRKLRDFPNPKILKYTTRKI